MLDLNTIIILIKKTAIEPYFYWQLLAILTCFLISYISYKITSTLLKIKIKGDQQFEKSNLNKIIANHIWPLFLPMQTIVILSIGTSIFSKFYVDIFLFSSFIQILSLLLFLRFLKVTIANNFIVNIAAAFLLPVLILNILGFLEPTITYLDSLAFTLGEIRISIYIIIKAVTILVTVFWLSGLISRKSKSYIKNNDKIKPNTKGILSKIIDMTIYFVVFVILLRVFGVNTTTFAVFGGAIGVGIGLGLQKIASNFIGGIILLFEKSIEIGDLVEIDGGIEGIITHFGGRYTLLETFDGKEIMVPNEEFIVNKVVNLTYNNNRGRVEVSVGVSYNSDIDNVIEIMINVAKEHERCLLYPAPSVYVTNFGDSSIDLIMHFWINNVSDGRLQPKSDVMIGIIKKFRESNIEIPFPQRDINFNNTLLTKK